MLSDQDLVARILERDAHAFEALFERYAEMIRRHLARIVDNEAALGPLTACAISRCTATFSRNERRNASSLIRAARSCTKLCAWLNTACAAESSPAARRTR